MSYWEERSVIVTGGASFIGSHLVDQLCKLSADVTVVDDLSSGTLENLSDSKKRIKFVKLNLETDDYSSIRKVFKDQSVVFHLAALRGCFKSLISLSDSFSR